jgi:DNA topoisomerase VI subunit B
MSDTKRNRTPAAEAPLKRQMFTFSRAKEYLDADELRTMTGQPADRFPDVIIKELCDNGLDAAEKVRVGPELTIFLRRRGGLLVVSIRDNGGGISSEAVGRIIDFQTRSSDKAAYGAPTRGLQGNATKTVLGIPYALGIRGLPVVIRTRGRDEPHGVRHAIHCQLDPAGEVRVRHLTRPAACPPGTTAVTLALPDDPRTHARFFRWAMAFSLFNPHATVRIWDSGAGGEACLPAGARKRIFCPTVAFPADWRKFLPGDRTSAWWFDDEALAKLVFAYISVAERGGPDLSLFEFVRQFRNLSAKPKARAVCARLPHIKNLTDFRSRKADVARLLGAMRAGAKAPDPTVLGFVGEEHLRARFARRFGVKRWWYKKCSGHVGGNVPFTLEVAVAETERRGDLFHGLNFSPTFSDPLSGATLPHDDKVGGKSYGLADFLDRLHVQPGRGLRPNVAVAFHLSSPGLKFTDKGKTRLCVPREIGQAAAELLWAAGKALWAEEERRQKDAAAQQRADRRRLRGGQGARMFLNEACFLVMEEAVAKATGKGHYQVSAHTLFYHVRPLIQRHTSTELRSDYFEQKVLPAYQRQRGPIPGLYYEPRGTLYEPHTGREVPLGTREVQGYTFPSWLYDKIIFVEKTGLWPVLKAARLAERYDAAIVAGEGYATEACRVLFANAEKGRDYQLFSFHDADPHGYNIARTLQTETERMPGHNITVIDVGLKLEEALAMGLPAEEFTRRKALPRAMERSLTDVEREYFQGKEVGRNSSLCRRVELNAFTAPDLIAYFESGLRRHGVRGKVVPDESSLPALVRELLAQALSDRTDEMLAGLLSLGRIKAELGEAVRRHVPLEDARAWVTEALAANPATSWRDAVAGRIADLLEEHNGEVEALLWSLVHRELGDS